MTRLLVVSERKHDDAKRERSVMLRDIVELQKYVTLGALCIERESKRGGINTARMRVRAREKASERARVCVCVCV